MSFIVDDFKVGDTVQIRPSFYKEARLNRTNVDEFKIVSANKQSNGSLIVTLDQPYAKDRESYSNITYLTINSFYLVKRAANKFREFYEKNY